MVDYDRQIQDLEAELKKTKYNKATQGHFAIVKAKIAQLREKQDQRVAKKTGKSDYGYSVRKSGDGTVLLLGFPSAGKSTLLNTLAGTDSQVAAYAFTTLTCIPGTLEYKQAQIQILDVPGIVSGAASGKGRGREVLAVLQNADLVLVVIDVNHPEHYTAILKEVYDSNIRINKVKPEVFIKKKASGGLHIGKTVALDLDDQTIKRVLWEYRIMNGEVLIRSPIDVDELIDCIEGNKKYLPAIICVTKVDLADPLQADQVKKQLNADIIVSAEQNINIELLKEAIFQKLNFMRIYLKEPRKEADMLKPMIIRRGSLIKDVCDKTHKDFVSKFKFARVWGASTKFPGQKLMTNHVLSDQDILEIHLR